MSTNDIYKKLTSFYNDFIMQDIAFVIGGILLLLSLRYSVDIQPIDIYDWLPNNLYSLAIIIILSYIAGFLMFSGFYFIIYNDNLKLAPVLPEGTILSILLHDIDKYLGNQPLIRFKRDLYLRHLSLNLFSSIFCCSIIFLISLIITHKQVDIVLFFLSIIADLISYRASKIYTSNIYFNTIQLINLIDKYKSGE